MNKIAFNVGMRIDEAAKALVRSAPAATVFNGIRVRARYATTTPRDIVAQFERDLEEQRIRWTNSAAGKRSRAEQEQRRCEAQALVDVCIKELAGLDMSDPWSVLAWVDRMAGPADHVGVTYDHDKVIKSFVTAGWDPGAYCAPDFNITNARKYAGWIVGQWLASKWPGITTFVSSWQERFGVKKSEVSA